MFELHRSFLFIVIKASGLCGKDKSGESFRPCQNNAAVVVIVSMKKLCNNLLFVVSRTQW